MNLLRPGSPRPRTHAHRLGRYTATEGVQGSPSDGEEKKR